MLFSWLLLYVTNQVVQRSFLHGVLTGLRITTRNSQNVPVLVVQLHRVTTVVVTRPTSFLTEQGVMEHRLRSQEAVLQFPCTKQFVNVRSCYFLQVFAQDRHLLQTNLQQLVVSHVVNTKATTVLVHQLLETVKTLTWVDVVRVNSTRYDLVTTNSVSFHWLIDLFLAALDLCVRYLNTFCLPSSMYLQAALAAKRPS